MSRPVAVVSGGSSNIGRACVARLAADGHRVLIADLRAPERALPDGVSHVAVDVTDAAACRAMADAAAALGPVVAFVHSAAITEAARPVESIDAAEWRRVIEVNLTGTFLAAQAMIAPLRASRGAMVLISSRAGRVGYAALSPTPAGTKPHYAASKAAVLSLARSLAVELAPDGVRVNAVVPGSIEGTMIPRSRWPELAARIPLGRLGTPAEVADAVAWLCSDQARYVTGHALDVNGGTWMN